MHSYILVDKEPVLCDTLDGESNRHPLFLTRVGADISVSAVFLGIDHGTIDDVEAALPKKLVRKLKV